jgi:hypothetical protein
VQTEIPEEESAAAERGRARKSATGSAESSMGLGGGGGGTARRRTASLAAASTKGGSGISVYTAARHNSGMEWIGQEWREGTGGLREMRRVSSFVGNDTWLQRVVRARCLTDLFLTTNGGNFCGHTDTWRSPPTRGPGRSGRP